MVDTQVEDVAETTLDEGHKIYGPYQINPNVKVVLHIEDGSNIVMFRTTDAGVGWGSPITVRTGTVRALNCFFDREVPGDTGTLVHLAFADRAGTDSIYYIEVDVNDGSVGTLRTVDATVTVDNFAQNNRVAITKTVSGNLLIGYSTQTEIGFARATDAGENWTTGLNDVYETATEEDWAIGFPASTADDDDAAFIFGDRSASTLTVKMWDNSAGTFTETAILGTITLDLAARDFDAAVRHSDTFIVGATHINSDTTGDDILVFTVDPDSIASPAVLVSPGDYANAVTNLAESGWCSVFINQQNDDVYVGTIAGTALLSLVDAVYYLSTDDLATFGSQQAYSVDTEDDLRGIASGRTVGDDGGHHMPYFFNTDINDTFVNTANAVLIAGPSGGIRNPFGGPVVLRNPLGA